MVVLKDPTTGATRSHKCRRDQGNRHRGRERAALEVRRSELPGTGHNTNLSDVGKAQPANTE